MSSSTLPGSEQVFPARLSALGETVAFTQGFCDRIGIGHSVALRLRLVIEELFANTVLHGYRGDSDAPVRIALGIIDEYLTVEYEDSAPQYDPLVRMTTLPAGQVTPIDGPPTDALGTYLLGKSLYGARYAYENGRNRLWLVMPRGPLKAPPSTA